MRGRTVVHHGKAGKSARSSNRQRCRCWL